MSLRVTRWAIAIVGSFLVLLAIVAGGGSRTAALRQLVIETLAERLVSEVQLESFSVDTFPTVHVTGTNLIIRGGFSGSRINDSQSVIRVISDW